MQKNAYVKLATLSFKTLPAVTNGRISMTIAFYCASGAVLGMMTPMKYWEMIADELSAAGWTWGYCSAVTRHGRRFVVDAYRGDGRRYIVKSDELLSAFLELESSLLP